MLARIAFAIALRAQLGYDEAGVPRRIHGGGITLGDTSLAWPEPCSVALGYDGTRGARVESFRGADETTRAAPPPGS